MLDIQGLPKNANGFRTTHTCELCGFEPKTKNKYREKQDHLVMKHFKEKIDKIFPHCRPYSCPAADCPFSGKDKQALLRHYTGKHGILDKYLKEALAEKGINYSPGEGGKRRGSANSDSSRGSGKNPRLSVTPPNGAAVQISPTPVAMTIVDAPNHNGGGIALNGKSPTKITLPHKPNTEELRKEVEAMMASFQPVEQPVVLHIPSQNGNTVNGKGGVVTAAKAEVVNGIPAGVTQVVTAIPVLNSPTSNVASSGPPSNASPVVNGVGGVATSNPTSQHVPITSLPAIVLSAVANATVASVQAKAKQQQQQQPTPTTLQLNGNSVIATSASLVTPNGHVSSITANGTVTAPGEKQAASVPTITVSSTPMVSSSVAQQQQQQQQAQQTPIVVVPPASSASSSVTNGAAATLPLVRTVSSSVSTTATSTPAPSTNGVVTSSTSSAAAAAIGSLSSSNPLPIEIIAKCHATANGGGDLVKSQSVVENEDVMWSASANGPAVIVESANALPVTYIETVDAGSLASVTTLDNMEYDYFAPVGATSNAIEVRERQLDFCML